MNEIITLQNWQDDFIHIKILYVYTQQEIELWRVINDMLIIETPYDHANNNMSEKTLVISIE